MGDYFAYDFIGFGAIDEHFAYDCIGFGPMDVIFPMNTQGLGPWVTILPMNSQGLGPLTKNVAYGFLGILGISNGFLRIPKKILWIPMDLLAQVSYNQKKWCSLGAVWVQF